MGLEAGHPLCRQAHSPYYLEVLGRWLLYVLAGHPLYFRSWGLTVTGIGGRVAGIAGNSYSQLGPTIILGKPYNSRGPSPPLY